MEKVANPMGYTEPGLTSVGLHTLRDGDEQFVMLAGDNDPDGMSVSIHSNDAVGSLADWLPRIVALQRTLDGPSRALEAGPVEMSPSGELVLREGARVVRSRYGADLPQVLQDQGESAISAEVRLADGSTLWVFARLIEGSGQLDHFPTEHADLDAFVAWVAKQFESGGGLR